jgi:hypothetical protein
MGCRQLAVAARRAASLIRLSTGADRLQHGGHTAAGGPGSRCARASPANLRASFSPHYLAQHVNGSCTRKQLLTESTWEAIRLGLTEKLLAEGQPAVGKNGHVLAVLTQQLSRAEVAAMRAARLPLQMTHGRCDVVAGLGHVQRLTRARSPARSP